MAALHHVATVGLAILSLLSLVLFRAIGPPPSVTPHRLLLGPASPCRSRSRLLLQPPPARAVNTTVQTKKPRRRPCWVPFLPTTLAVGSLWAVKLRRPHWGTSPHSYDVSGELLAFTPGAEGLGEIVASVLTLGLFEQRERQRDPNLALDLDLPPIVLKTCAAMYLARTLLACPSFPLFGSQGFYSLGVALAYASIAPELPMWGYVGYEAATSLHDLTTTISTTTTMAATSSPRRRSLREGALTAILRVTTAALVAQEQGCRRWQREERRVVRELPPLRATPLGHGPNNQTAKTTALKTRRRRRARKLKPKTTTMATIHVGTAARPSSRPPGPIIKAKHGGLD